MIGGPRCQDGEHVDATDNTLEGRRRAEGRGQRMEGKDAEDREGLEACRP